MKVSELIESLQKCPQNFQISASWLHADGSDWGVSLEEADITGVSDIAYSSRKVVLSFEPKEGGE